MTTERERKEQATAWLAGLFVDPWSRMTWQTFDDSGRERQELVGHFTGTLADSWDRLRRLNDAGAGVFAMINEGDGRGRSTGNVRRVRAYFIDCDDDPPTAFHAEPSMVVASGRGVHAYWCVADGLIAEFSSTQRRLIRYYGSDRSVHDLPRVMRVAGFDHRKGAPRLVTVQTLGPWGMHRHADVVEGLPELPAERRARKADRVKASRDDVANRERYGVELGEYDIVSAFRDRGWLGRERDGGMWTVACPWIDQHTTGRDPMRASDTVVWEASGGMWPQFKCQHDSCADRTNVDVLRELGAIGGRNA